MYWEAQLCLFESLRLNSCLQHSELRLFTARLQPGTCQELTGRATAGSLQGAPEAPPPQRTSTPELHSVKNTQRGPWGRISSLIKEAVSYLLVSRSTRCAISRRSQSDSICPASDPHGRLELQPRKILRLPCSTTIPLNLCLPDRPMFQKHILLIFSFAENSWKTCGNCYN